MDDNANSDLTSHKYSEQQLLKMSAKADQSYHQGEVKVLKTLKDLLKTF